MGAMVTADTGAWCPILPQKLMLKRLASSKFKVTGLGLEKLCKGCGEYWPFDTEFWHTQPGALDGTFNVCKACYRENRNQTPAARAEARHHYKQIRQQEKQKCAVAL